MKKSWVWLCTVAFCTSSVTVNAAPVARMIPYTDQWDVKLTSLKPQEILTKLDLIGPGLEQASAAAAQGDRSAALSALRNYYRGKFPLRAMSPAEVGKDIKTADNITKHIFHWGPYEPADYGKDINWELDPRSDIEWVAAIYRFYWAESLTKAYAATRDDKYASAFVELVTDWVHKHPLDNWTKPLHVHGKRQGFAWLDLQTGIRARRITDAFKTLVHSDAFTPEFLGLMLASLYDHQIKTAKIPMGMIANKAIFEQRGFVNVAATFSEFKESRSWIEVGLKRTRTNLLAQVTIDGVQREWCGSYHLSMTRDAAEIMNLAESAGVPVEEDYRSRVRAMYDYIFNIATPDLGFPMFGDTGRPILIRNERSQSGLYSELLKGTALLCDPKYADLARLDPRQMPRQTSAVFHHAGTCVLRSGSDLDQVYFALHCPPRGISGHDQPDNGTFELWAYGRWLMTDTGFFTYGNDAAKRAWHRQTKVHQTLTLDGKDSNINGKVLIWKTAPTWDAVVVENEAYPNLLHRRNVWFVDRRLLVVLDEAIGTAPGTLDLHFQLAAGESTIDKEHNLAKTNFDDANVLVWADPQATISMEEEEGWFAWDYGYRKPRKAFRYQHQSAAPTRFLTVIAPYRGTQTPQVSATLAPETSVGSPEVEVAVQAFGQQWRLGRNLAEKEAWCREESRPER